MMPDSTEGFNLLWTLRQHAEQYFREVQLMMVTAIQERTGLLFHARAIT